MIEDPREVERKRLIGIDDSDGPTREELVAALEEVSSSLCFLHSLWCIEKKSCDTV